MAFPNSSQWFTSIPLYSIKAFEDKDAWAVIDLIYSPGTYDSYCTGCKRDSTFVTMPPQAPEAIASALTMRRSGRSVPFIPGVPSGLHSVASRCTRDANHRHFFCFYVAPSAGSHGGTMEKIGQLPSFSDLRVHQISKYKHVLTEDQMREFARAIGLASHDVGVGAYVYLRRIYEALVEEAHVESKGKAGWDEATYERSRMSEKIGLLAGVLPEFLVKNASMYSLLSKGIHELSEVECLTHFDTLRIGIELILDEKHERRERIRKVADAEKAIQRALSGMGPN